jgi:hypothetical protein
MLRKRLALAMCGLLAASAASADVQPGTPEAEYRALTLKIRPKGRFKVPMVGTSPEFNYAMNFGAPLFEKPIVNDFVLSDPKYFFRNFYDKVFLEDGSYLKVNGEEIPLTCVFVKGQDNRYSGKSGPQFPEILLKIYLVANDFTCTGPINPGWPENGGKKETWDTYLYYEVRDPTIMLPTEITLRYRWNESHAILVEDGE